MWSLGFPLGRAANRAVAGHEFGGADMNVYAWVTVVKVVAFF